MMHCSGPITSVGEERVIIFSAFACGLCNEEFPLPIGAWDWLCYFIVTYPCLLKKNMKILNKKSTENCHFYSREKSLYFSALNHSIISPLCLV